VIPILFGCKFSERIQPGTDYCDLCLVVVNLQQEDQRPHDQSDFDLRSQGKFVPTIFSPVLVEVPSMPLTEPPADRGCPVSTEASVFDMALTSIPILSSFSLIACNAKSLTDVSLRLLTDLTAR
jgi:hypothetical protein